MKKISRSEAVEKLSVDGSFHTTDYYTDEFPFVKEDSPAENDKPQQVEKHQVREETLLEDEKVKYQQVDSDRKRKKIDPAFAAGLDEMELHIEEDGIYSYHQGMRIRRANFSRVSFEYTIRENDTRLRVYRFNDKPIKLRPQDLISKASCNRCLLEQSNFQIDLSTAEFDRLKILLIEMDNGRVAQNKSGFGRVADGIFNLGNKIMIDDQLQDFKPLIWQGDTGYALEHTDQIIISENPLALGKIAQQLFQLYGNKAIVMLGFATASLFFQQFMKLKKHFPLLYLKGASGHGKSCIAELNCKLSGMDESLYIINFAGNSTIIGSEIKAVRLNNLPIVFNEFTEDKSDLVKSRFDGHGSSKFTGKTSSNLSERPVNNPTIVTTVVNPHDKQIITRSVFVDLDEIEMKKSVFDEVRAASSDFSGFIVKIIQSLSIDILVNQVDRFVQMIGKTEEPRILDNYSLIGGSFMAFKSICDDISGFPSDEEVLQFIKEQISQTESLLNPVPALLYELERMLVTGKAKSFITQDEEFVYFNFEGVWSEISPAYKRRYFPFMSKRNLQEQLKKSEFIAKAGKDLQVSSKFKDGELLTQFPKKINSSTRRCFVLKKDRLPGYFR